jgi:nitrogen fixation/metabolism regulation signal transduction histidine kinase
MTIKKRLTITAIITLILALAVSHVLYSATKQLTEELEESKIANEILESVFELNVVSSDFLLYPEERAINQWYLKHDSLTKLLATEIFTYLEEKETLDQLSANNQKMKRVFDQMSNQHSGSDQTDSADYSDPHADHKDLENRLASQLLLLSQDIVTDASALSEKVRIEAIEQLESLRLMVASAIIIFSLIITIGIFLIIKVVMRPILKLRQGSEMFKKGNLGYRVDVNSKDEIGELASSFNKMAENLQKSQANIEKKIADRTAKLEKLNKHMTGRELKMIELKEEIKKLKSK